MVFTVVKEFISVLYCSVYTVVGWIFMAQTRSLLRKMDLFQSHYHRWGWGCCKLKVWWPLTKEAYLLTKLCCCTLYNVTLCNCQLCCGGIDSHYSKKSKQPFKAVSLTSSAVHWIGIYLKENAEMLESKPMIIKT